MDENPYQSPQVADQAEIASESLAPRTRGRLVIGTCCVGIALLFSVVGFTVPGNVRQWQTIWFVLGSFAAGFAVMGVGMFARRDKIALAGFVLLALPPAVAVYYRLTR